MQHRGAEADDQDSHAPPDAARCTASRAVDAVRRGCCRPRHHAGGRAAGSAARSRDRSGCELKIAPRELCTDNAVMGALAWERIDLGDFDDLRLDVQPGLLRHKH